jgi:regulator of sigma E protease
MSILLGILLAFIVFLVVVLVHEFGHFSTARLTKMRVEEFGFGLPPRAFKLFKDKKGTEYTWNWLPIWGFVRILGEDPTGEDANKVWAFMTRPWAARVLVLVAGVTMNFFLAFVIFTGLFLSGTAPIAVNPISSDATHSFFIPSFDEAVDMGYLTHDGVEISAISGSIAAVAGIHTWEKVLQVNWSDSVSPEEFIKSVQKNLPLTLLLEHSGATRTLSITPVDGKIGVRVGYHGLDIDKTYVRELGLTDAIVAGGRETYASSMLTFSFLGKLVHGIFAPDTATEREEAKNMLSWPIGVGATFVGLVEIAAPLSLILIVTALISINLWVVNLLPIPALDGGRIITTTLYSIIVRFFHRGKARFLQVEKYFHALWFLLLLLLTVYVAGVDIARFF